MEQIIGQGLGGGTGTDEAADVVFDTTTQGFRADVVEASRDTVVLVDFWAPWCGPCKQLTPLIERAVRAARGRVRLAKMNIDEHPAIPGQLGIQSIPAVIAFKGGQPVDGFMGALPESQIAAFIERVAGPPENGAAAALEEGDAALLAGDLAGAAGIFGQILAAQPDHVGALAGLAKALIAAGELDQARQTLALVPEAKRSDPSVAGALAALALAEQGSEVGETAGLEAQVAGDPDDHQARFDLALALNANGAREAALDHLLEIMRRERDWNEDAARKQIVQMFEAWGFKDPLAVAGRRKLSSILFA